MISTCISPLFLSNHGQHNRKQWITCIKKWKTYSVDVVKIWLYIWIQWKDLLYFPVLIYLDTWVNMDNHIWFHVLVIMRFHYIHFPLFYLVLFNYIIFWNTFIQFWYSNLWLLRPLESNQFQYNFNFIIFRYLCSVLLQGSRLGAPGCQHKDRTGQAGR